MTRQGDIQEKAAWWLLRQEESGWSDAEQRELERWLDENMAHKAAFWRLRHGWRQADRIASIGQDAPVACRQPWRPLRRQWLGPAIAASLIAAVAAGSWWSVVPGHGNEDTVVAEFATRKGQRRIVALSDGSRMEMNTASRLRAAPAEPGRQDVWLDQGEAFFDIAHRPERIFVVHAGSQQITVLGTRFAVRREGMRTTVTVMSGRVRIDGAESADRPSASALVSRGSIAVAEGDGTLVARSSEERIEALLAWRDGMLDFTDTPIGDAVAEFNRYNDKQIEVGSSALASRKISGSFRSNDSAGFLRLISQVYGVPIQNKAGAITIG